MRIQEPLPSDATAGAVESTYAIGLDGSNDYISLGANKIGPLISGATAVSISLWCRYTSLVGSASQFNNAIFGAWIGAGNTNNVWINLRSDAGQVGKVLVGGRSQSADSLQSTTSDIGLGIGKWYHVVGILDFTNDRISIYINGRLAASTAVTFGSNTYTHTTGVNDDAIGRDTSATAYFHGRLDDIRLYARALTDAEIQSIHRNSSSPPTSGLVAHWAFEEGTGTSATDSAGSTTGTLTNGPTWQPQACPRLIAGRLTQTWGLQLDGTDDYVAIANAGILDSSQAFTISGWFKTTSTSAELEIFTQSNSGNNNPILFVTVSSGKIEGGFRSDSGTIADALSTIAAFNDGAWHHVAVVRRLSSPYIEVYLDGVSVATSTTNPGTSTYNRTTIGAMRRGTTQGYFNGTLKDIRCYQSELSVASIIALARGKSTADTLAGRWSLDDGTGTTAADSGASNNGTLTNGPTWSGDVPTWFRQTIESTNSLSCDGVNDRITIPDANDISFVGDFSISAWCNPSTGAATKGLVDKSSGGTVTSAPYSLWSVYTGLSNDSCFFVTSGSPARTSQPSTNQWTHLCARMGASLGLSLFKNGVKGTNGSAGSRSDNGLPLIIGGMTDSGTGSFYFAGLIDEVVLYNRALTDDEAIDLSAGYLVPAGLVSRYKFDGNADDAVGSNHGTENGGVGYSSSVPGTL